MPCDFRRGAQMKMNFVELGKKIFSKKFTINSSATTNLFFSDGVTALSNNPCQKSHATKDTINNDFLFYQGQSSLAKIVFLQFFRDLPFDSGNCAR